MRGEKKTHYTQRKKTTFTADFSSETKQARRKWSDTFKIPEEKKKNQHRIVHVVKISFKNK